MKRSHSFFVFALLSLALLFSACGADDPVEVSTGTVTEPASQDTEPDLSSSGTDDALDDEVFDDEAFDDEVMDDQTSEPADSGEWQLVRQRNDLSGAAPHPILDLVVIDETQIGVRFEAIGEGCSGAQAFADENATEVAIELFVGLPPEAMTTTCMNELVKKQIVVELSSPLAGRTLRVKAGSQAAPDAVPTAAPELSLNDYIGMSEPDAIRMAEANGRPARVVRVNGEWLASTDDFIPQRLNLEIVDGIVVALTTDAGEVAGDPGT